MGSAKGVKVLELARVGPPPGSVAESSLPLTFFDVIWLEAPPLHQIFFYKFPHPNTTLLLNSLKRSLSLALQLFYPLAGALTFSPNTRQHEIRYIDGDSVQLTLAESDSDFHQLLQDTPKDVSLLHPLLPNLPTSGNLLSLQITIFPNSGICIAISIHHVAADGSSTMQFMKSWASISRIGPEVEKSSLSVYDRGLIADPRGLKTLFLEQMANGKLDESWRVRVEPVLATFLLSRDRIERLRQRVAMTRRRVNGEKLPQYSAFALTCAHIWVCLVRSGVGSCDETAHFKFDSGCRARMHPPIPVTYFGNCIKPCFVHVSRADLEREDGIFVACEAIWRVIQGLDGDGVSLKDAERWIPRSMSIAESGERLVSVAWSPKIGVYDTDFGFGRPCKVDVIAIEETGAISLMERRDGGEGFEVGMVLPKCEMKGFSYLLEEGLKEL